MLTHSALDLDLGDDGHLRGGCHRYCPCSVTDADIQNSSLDIEDRHRLPLLLLIGTVNVGDVLKEDKVPSFGATNEEFRLLGVADRDDFVAGEGGSLGEVIEVGEAEGVVVVLG